MAISGTLSQNLQHCQQSRHVYGGMLAAPPAKSERKRLDCKKHTPVQHAAPTYASPMLDLDPDLRKTTHKAMLICRNLPL